MPWCPMTESVMTREDKGTALCCWHVLGHHGVAHQLLELQDVVLFQLSHHELSHVGQHHQLAGCHGPGLDIYHTPAAHAPSASTVLL